MGRSEHESLPPELAEIADSLREARPMASAFDLDRIKRRALQQGRSSGPQGSRLRSRFAITALLVAGLVMSGGGATLAVTAVSQEGSAGIAQYPQGGGGGALGEEQESDGGDTQDQQGVGGRERGGGVSGDDRGQPARQVAATGDRAGLPFTGLAAIPLMVLGLVALVGGVVLRRRVPDRV